MAYPGVHKLLAFGGPLRVSETWSCSLRMSLTGFDGDEAAEQALCDDYTQVIQTWATTNSIISANATLGFVKFNTIDTTGRYLMPYTILTEVEPVTPMGTGTSPHVNQVSLVATLLTGVPRGLAARGRIFLPLPKAPVDNDGRISTTLQSSYGTQVRDLLDALNGVSPTSKVCVASDVREGAIRPVTAVGIGRVLDTMRSRRTSLEEERSTVALATVP